MAIIAISRGSMELGQGLAEKVASRLGCPCVDREIIVEAAHRLGVSQETMTQKMERVPSFWERLTFERKAYVVAMQAALAEHVLQGDFVYHSWAGHMLLRGIPVLRLRIIAPLEQRVQLLVERQSLSREQALSLVQRADEERARWTRFIYGIDWTDPSEYDAVLNLSAMSIDTACDSAVTMARRPEFSLQWVRDRLESFALAARTRLVLALHPATRLLDLEVTAEGERVTITCVAAQSALTAAMERTLEEELRTVTTSVSGVKEVKLSIRPVPST
jgi:cytidylate kinase